MTIHVRIQNAANLIALQVLECSTYKVLMYLATRGDKVGRSYPSVETIAQDCAMHPQTVYKALDSLSMEGYICYLRKNAYDPIIGKKLPNVYMVSPHFMELAADNVIEANNLWSSHFTKISYINQQQNHVQESIPYNQLQKQQQQPQKSEPATNPENFENANTKISETPKANREPQRATASAATNKQRSENKSRSSAIVKKYTNPLSITEPLPDGLSELLAERVNSYGIPKPMARGFVFKYGYEHVSKSATYFEFVKHVQSDIKSPAGFFRSILENGTADSDLPEQMQLVGGSRDYADYDSYLES